MTIKTQRIILTIILFVLSATLIWVVWHHFDKIYYSKAHDCHRDSWRLLWLAPFASLGLSIRSFQLRHNPDPPWMAYFKYVFALGITGMIMFSVFHNLLPFDNWQYYPLSAVLIFLVGLNPWRSSYWVEKLIDVTGGKQARNS